MNHAKAPTSPKILIFVITGARRREKNQRQPAAVSENEHFKFTAQPRCVPFDVTFVHIVGVISSEAGGEVEKSLVRSSAFCPSPQSSPRKTGRGGRPELLMLQVPTALFA